MIKDCIQGLKTLQKPDIILQSFLNINNIWERLKIDKLNEVEKEEDAIKNQLELLSKQKSIVPLIGSLFTLFLTLGLGIQLKIIFYWIPSSFIVILFLFLLPYIKDRKKQFDEETAKKNIELVDKFNIETLKYGAELIIKKLIPIIWSISILFLINIIILLGHYSDTITLPISNNFNLIVIGAVSLLMIIEGFFLIERFPVMFIEIIIPSIRRVKGYQKNEKIPPLFRNNLIKIGLAFGILMIFAFIILFIWSLLILLPIIENLAFLIITIFMQIVTILMFSSYISYIKVKLELDKCLIGIQKIKDGELNENDFKQIIRFSRFEIDTSFKFVNYFAIIRHLGYLKQLKGEE